MVNKKVKMLVVRAVYANRLENRSNANARNNLGNENNQFVENLSLLGFYKMYNKICSKKNLILAWKKSRKGKTKKRYVKRFGNNLIQNIIKLNQELNNQIYFPCPLKQFILRDPKTRKISKSAFRDRIVHHALCNIISPLFEKNFIYDSHANQIGKGTIKATERFDKFKRKVSQNNTKNCFVLKADIKHYFQEVNHEILLNLIKRKINCLKTLKLIKTIIERERERDVQFI